MSDTENTLTEKAKENLKYWGMIAGAVIVAFLIGFVPMWMVARSNAAERDAVSAQLRRSEIKNLLSSSIVDARRGEYEPARQSASEFYTRLRAEDEKGNDGFLSADQRTKMANIYSERDATITMLAQRDPAALERLTDVYVAYTTNVPAE